jgi:hypothetical protein
MRHTPGPWTVESVNSEALHDICLDYRIPGAGHPVLIATVFDDENPGRPGDISTIEAEANARLMAAAPDLLAACELWDQGFTEGEQFTPEQFRVWVNKNRAAARAAIAKAKRTTQA